MLFEINVCPAHADGSLARLLAAVCGDADALLMPGRAEITDDVKAIDVVVTDHAADFLAAPA